MNLSILCTHYSFDKYLFTLFCVRNIINMRLLRFKNQTYNANTYLHYQIEISNFCFPIIKNKRKYKPIEY